MIATGAMSVGNLIAQFRVTYEDSELAERAARKLSVIQQDSKPFNTFLAEFDRTILDAGGLEWFCQVKKTFLSNCLSDELQIALVVTPMPTKYQDYCSLFHTVSTNLEAVRKRKQRNGRYRAITSPAAETVVAEDAMDWESIPVTAIAVARV
jgi:hypothetical protein